MFKLIVKALGIIIWEPLCIVVNIKMTLAYQVYNLS